MARWTRPALVLVAVVFSALTSAPAAAPKDFHDLIRRQFEIYDPDYQVHRQRYGERLTALAKALAEAQANGRILHCSQQMFLEAKWLHRYTGHWSRLEDKLKRIEKSYWGAWYVVSGKIHKSVDLSMTYHIIAYTKGRVEHGPHIIATTTAIEADPYPYGWRHMGRYNNHNLYDVAKIYKFGWPHMSPAERHRTKTQIRSMIEWSLSNTLEADGSLVADSTFSDSLADEYYFGVSFLDVVGYWQPERRFWTDAPADRDAAATCCRLKHWLEQLDLEGWAAEGAMRKLERSCGQC